MPRLHMGSGEEPKARSCGMRSLESSSLVQWGGPLPLTGAHHGPALHTVLLGLGRVPAEAAHEVPADAREGKEEGEGLREAAWAWVHAFPRPRRSSCIPCQTTFRGAHTSPRPKRSPSTIHPQGRDTVDTLGRMSPLRTAPPTSCTVWRCATRPPRSAPAPPPFGAAPPL